MDPFDGRQLSEALASAALNPDNWMDALETVARETRSYGAIILPVVGPMPIMAWTKSMDQSAERYVSEGWVQRDERYRGTAQFLQRGVVSDRDCVTDEERRRSPFYQDFIAANQLSECAIVRVGRGDRVWSLSLQRAGSQEAFSDAEMAWLAAFSNTLDSVATVSLALAHARGSAVLDAFDCSATAAFLIDRSAQVVRVNQAAEHLIGSDLTLNQRKIQSTSPKATDLFNSGVKTVFWGQSTTTVPPVVFPKADGGKLILYLMPLPAQSDMPLSAFHAIVVVADTAQQTSPRVETLQSVFGMTQAEAHIAAALANGVNIDSYAVSRKISKETARHHLKSVFSKVGVNRQIELVRVIGQLLPQR